MLEKGTLFIKSLFKREREIHGFYSKENWTLQLSVAASEMEVAKAINTHKQLRLTG